MNFAPPVGVTVAVLVVGGLLAAILPTCLYLYVEPRGRRQWAAQGDTPASRRSPVLVRVSAWLGFVVAQLALPMLLVPVLCGGLLYAQIRLGAIRPVALGVTALVGLAALAQAAVALRLVPLGVRLLAHDGRLARSLAARARAIALMHAALLGGALLVGWALSTMPNLVHPVVRWSLVLTALRPVIGFGVVSLLHGILLSQCAGLVADARRGATPGTGNGSSTTNKTDGGEDR